MNIYEIRTEVIKIHMETLEVKLIISFAYCNIIIHIIYSAVCFSLRINSKSKESVKYNNFSINFAWQIFFYECYINKKLPYFMSHSIVSFIIRINIKMLLHAWTIAPTYLKVAFQRTTTTISVYLNIYFIDFTHLF